MAASIERAARLQLLAAQIAKLEERGEGRGAEAARLAADLDALLGAPSAEEHKPCTNRAVATFAFALACSVGASLLSKALYQLDVLNSEGLVVKFTKPLWLTFTMFLATATALPAHAALVGRPRISARALGTSLALAAMDLCGTTLSFVGLLHVPASTYQLVRASVIVFVACYRAALRLPPRLRARHWRGVALNAAAIGIVSASALAEAAGDARAARGVALLVFGCALTAAQLVAEECLLKHAGAAGITPPLVLLGAEGCCGVALTLAVGFPLAARVGGSDPLGCFENTADTLEILLANPAARAMNGAYLGCLAGYNMAAIHLTFELEAVWRSMLENFRPSACGRSASASSRRRPGSSASRGRAGRGCSSPARARCCSAPPRTTACSAGPARPAPARGAAARSPSSPLPEYGASINRPWAQDHAALGQSRRAPS